MTPINGKAIYTPKGRAQEYSPLACNFFTGCSNDCAYCYCKRGILGRTWSIVPKLKKIFRNEDHAIECFKTDLLKLIPTIGERSILFSFTTDPMLPETLPLTAQAVDFCINHAVPVQILTKRTSWNVEQLSERLRHNSHLRRLVSIGISLTGHPELEPGASSNEERIEHIKYLHALGFVTTVSLEPIIYLNSTMRMIKQTIGHVDLYKIGLLSGPTSLCYGDLNSPIQYVKPYVWNIARFVREANMIICGSVSKVYWKNSITSLVPMINEHDHVVSSGYNIFDIPLDPIVARNIPCNTPNITQ